jgi:preprotein translocase subunit YajC
METNKTNLFVGFLIGVVLIVLYVYIPYVIQEKKEMKRKQEVIDSLKRNLYQPPKTKNYSDTLVK